MPLSRRMSHALAGAAAAALAATSVPQPAAAQPAAFRTPQFIATAISFKALHETHYNWMGSDEVHAVYFDFVGLGVGGTSVFGDVDAGESRTIPPQQSCISPQPKCDRGASSLGFGIALLEIDDWVGGFFYPVYCHGALSPPGPPPTPEQFETSFDNYVGAKCPGDDFIGHVKVKLSEADLVTMLPTIGAFVDTTVRLTGGDARYDFTYRITRLPNTLNIRPIGEPVALGITLEAMATSVAGPKRVVLTWTNAATPTVDIYRGGALLTTTANDGTYDDPVQPGTYQYRLCNAGSTTACSPTVTVVVT